MNKSVIITVIIVIIVAIGAFFGGVQYQKSKSGSAFGGRSGFASRFGGAGGAGGAAGGLTPTRGQIVSNSGSSIVIKLSDGSSKIVLISGSTSIMKSAKASASDLTSGSNVVVLGTTNSDGSLTAESVSINPQNMFNRAGGNNSGSGPAPSQ